MENKFHHANNNKIPIIEANNDKIPMIGNQIESVSFTHHSILVFQLQLIFLDISYISEDTNYYLTSKVPLVNLDRNNKKSNSFYRISLQE